MTADNKGRWDRDKNVGPMEEFLRHSRARMREMTLRQICLQSLGAGLGAGIALFFVNHSWRTSLGEAAAIVLGMLLWALWLRHS